MNAEKPGATPTQVEGHWRPLCNLGFNDQAGLENAPVAGVFPYLLTRLADGFRLRLEVATGLHYKVAWRWTS
jgi:hypothetical protein